MKTIFKDSLNEKVEMKQKYYIYTLSDPIDGEVKYVGKTKNLKNRFWAHNSPYSLKDSWTSKNKWLLWLKNQELKPMIDVLDESDADNIDNLEIYWIGQLKQWGFKLKNDTSGGQGADYWTGKKIPEESKLKTLMNNPLRREVCEYEIGTDKLLAEYISTREASRKTGHKVSTIIDSCKGKSTPSKFGHYWRYKDEYFPYVERELKHTKEELLKMKMNHPNRKSVCQYQIETDELVKEYDSVRQSEKETGINRRHIIGCCKGTKSFNSAGGYYWRYKDNYFPFVNTPETIGKYNKKYKNK